MALKTKTLSREGGRHALNLTLMHRQLLYARDAGKFDIAHQPRCESAAKALQEPKPITGSWPAHLLDGHRLRRRPGTAAAALPWYSPDRSPAAGQLTGSMAIGCASDQERLQVPCPGTPRPITGCWPAHRIDGHRLCRRPGTAAAALPWYSPTDHRQLAGTAIYLE